MAGEAILKCKTCGHDEGDHEAVMDTDDYPHDYEQFCMGGDDCVCGHFEYGDDVNDNS